jgi:nicotinate phosphoribosyltransferase
VPNAIRVFEELRAAGHEPAGIRLDSGDLAHLAVESARMLDDAGFERARIVLSGDLDEVTIWQVRTQVIDEAPKAGLHADALCRRLVYGVGTRLITSEGDPALGGVYKLTAITDESGAWLPALKLSENPAKVPITGPKACWRLHDQRGRATVDLMTAPDEVPFDGVDRMTLHHHSQSGVRREVHRDEISRVERLHHVAFSAGRATRPPSTLEELRARCRTDVEQLDPGVRRMVNPHRYHVSLSDRLHRIQQETVERLRVGR